MVVGVVPKHARLEWPEPKALLEMIAEELSQPRIGRGVGSRLEDGRDGRVIRRGAAVALAAVYARFGHTEAA